MTQIIKIGPSVWAGCKLNNKVKRKVNEEIKTNDKSKPPTASQHHMDSHVWSYPQQSYIFIKCVKGFGAMGVEI